MAAIAAVVRPTAACVARCAANAQKKMPIVDEPADEMMSAIAFCTRRPGRGRSHCSFFDVGLVILFTVLDY